MHKIRLFIARLQPHHISSLETVMTLACLVIVFASTSAGAAVTRLTERSVLVYDQNPSVATKYEFRFTYNTTDQPVGSIDFLFCYNPIPTDPCIAPIGLDASNAVLSDQTGETGFTILSRSANHIVITRTPGMVGNTPSTYSFTGIINPSSFKSFAVRLSDYPTTDATGPEIDIGSVVTGISEGIEISTQVPPMMYFCVAQQVSLDCENMTGGNYSDLGNLDPGQTLTATSQMAAGTNASGGYVITANGPTMTAGTSIIEPLTSPTPSAPGNSQFGLNLVANSSPAIGADADGTFVNANPAPGYNIPNQFKYTDGDIVASAPNVSLVRRYTVSYIVNSPPNLRAGVYTTTITFICTGRF